MGSTMLVEAVRLIIVVAFAGGSYRLSRETGMTIPGLDLQPETVTFAVTAVGTGIGYVGGGVLARAMDAGLQSVESRLAARHASELLAATLGLLVGLAIASLVVWPVLILFDRPEITYPLAALVALVLATLATRFAVRKRLELFGVLGVPRSPDDNLPSGGCLLDASAAIDGRILALWKAGLLPAPVCVPSFIIWELQGIADSADPTRRRRGQRGLDVLASLREAGAIVRVIDEDPAGTTEPDAKLLIVARRHGMPVVTSDANLAKAGELQGLRVLSLHALADLLRPPVIPGERVRIRLIKQGRERGQGVGYLDDGTMVVVEQAADRLGQELDVEVSSVLQNPTGRMLFGTATGDDGDAGDQPPDDEEPPRPDLRSIR